MTPQKGVHFYERAGRVVHCGLGTGASESSATLLAQATIATLSIVVLRPSFVLHREHEFSTARLHMGKLFGIVATLCAVTMYGNSFGL
jgi:hypothetical protein